MKKSRRHSTSLENAQSQLKTQKIEFELFVSGVTPKSIRAIEKLKEICDTHFANRYTLKVIDIYREPELAKLSQIFAVPTLITRQSGHLRRFIGDLSDSNPILRAFGGQKEARK